MSSRLASPPIAAGEILTTAAYTRREIKQRLGWTDSAMRAAIRAGFPVRKLGKQQVGIGSEIVDWLRQQPLVGQPQEAGR